VRAVSLSRALEARFAGMTAKIESNAVPDAWPGAMLLIRWTKVGKADAGSKAGQDRRLIARQAIIVLHKK